MPGRRCSSEDDYANKTESLSPFWSSHLVRFLLFPRQSAGSPLYYHRFKVALANKKQHAAETRLLLLLGLELTELLLTSSLVSLSTSLGVQAVVPPSEAGSVVADELLVVKIVVLGTSPERKEVAQAPGEVVAAVGVDGLEETESDPDVHGEQVQLASDAKEDNGGADDTNAEESSLDGRSVLSSEAERSRVGVVHLVDGLVEGTVVQATVEPVVPSILHDEANSNLKSHLPERGEANTVVHSEVGGNGVEEPDLRKLGGEVANEDNGGAVPLLLERGHLLRLDLEAVEVGNQVAEHVGNATAKVDELVEDEAHNAGGEGVVLHPEIPGLFGGLVYVHARRSRENATYGPGLLQPVELDIVLGDLIESIEIVLGLIGSMEGRVSEQE